MANVMSKLSMHLKLIENYGDFVTTAESDQRDLEKACCNIHVQQHFEGTGKMIR